MSAAGWLVRPLDPPPAEGGGGRYRAALSTLRQEITAGRFRSADMLPSERDVADLLSVSRTTLRRVLARLADEGLLVQRQGLGTFVTRGMPAPGRTEPPRPEVHPLPGFADDMRRRGHEPSSREVERGTVLPTAQDALVLACSPDASLFNLCRLRYADGVPMALERAVAPTALVGDAVGSSLRATLAERGFTPVRSLDRVQAVLMSEGEAARLDAARGSPALLVSRAFYLADGRCCLHSRSVFRADRYDLLLEQGSAVPSARNGA